MSDLGDWFRTVPFFTRYWLASTVGFTLLGRFGILRPQHLVLFYKSIKNFEIWRLITCVLYYPLTPQTGFHYLINLYFLYSYSKRLEETTYAGRPADYAFMLIFNWLCCLIIGIFFDLPLLMDPMVLSVLYVWCQLNKDTIVTFWFGTRFKAIYLPWVLFGFNMVINGGGTTELIGILIGHLYFFLMFKYPQELGGRSFLQTPAFLKSIFPDEVGGVYTFGAPPERQPTQNPDRPPGGGFFGRHAWGQGHVLGRN